MTLFLNLTSDVPSDSVEKSRPGVPTIWLLTAMLAPRPNAPLELLRYSHMGPPSMSNTHLPQGLCTAYSLCLEHSSLRYLKNSWP